MLGLVCAVALADRGHTVTLLESAADVGGLTASQTLTTPRGEVACDRYYHVVLETDRRVKRLFDLLGLADSIRWTSAPATVASGGIQYPATGMIDMARLPALSFGDRVRVGASIAASIALPMDVARGVTAHRWLGRVAGDTVMSNFWEPILRAKLGTRAPEVSAAFLVSTFRRLVSARLHGGGDRFGVVPHGYAPVLQALRDRVAGAGIRVRTEASVSQVVASEGTLRVELDEGGSLECDRVLLTTPGPVTNRLVPQLLSWERKRLTAAPYLGVICAALLLTKPPNDAYITYVVDDLGITGVIGTHALVDPATTRDYSLVYVPRYCAPDDPWFEEPEEVLLGRLVDAAKKALPGAPFEVVSGTVSKARYVMPVPTPRAPEPLPYRKSVPGLYVASAAQNFSGTLNVEGTLAMAAQALELILQEQ